MAAVLQLEQPATSDESSHALSRALHQVITAYEVLNTAEDGGFSDEIAVASAMSTLRGAVKALRVLRDIEAW